MPARALVLVLQLLILVGSSVEAFARHPADTLRVRMSRDQEAIFFKGSRLIGRGFVARPDTLTFVADQSGDTLLLPLDSIRDLEVRRGDQSHFWKGAGIGAGIGALIGTIAGYASGDDPVDETCILCNIVRMTAEEKAAGGAIMGTLVGAAAGGLVGVSVRTERFVPIAPEKLQVALRGGPDGSLRLALTVP